MIIERTFDWTTPAAYFATPPSRWRLLVGLIERVWLERQAADVLRREARAQQRLRDACRDMPGYLRRDIGLP